MTRSALAGLLTLLATIAMVIALLAVHCEKVLSSQQGFTSHAVSVWDSSQVQGLAARRVTDAVVPQSGLLSAAQPVVEQGVREVTTSGPAKAVVREVADQLQPQLISGTADHLTLSLPIGSLLASHLQSLNSQVAAVVRQAGDITVFSVAFPSSASTVIHLVARVGSDSGVLVLICIALILAALLVSPDRFRTLTRLGTGALVGGLVVIIAYFGLRTVVLGQLSGDSKTAVSVVWDTYIGGLMVTAVVMAAIGAAVAVLGTLLRR